MTIQAFNDQAVFHAFVEQVLVPVLRPGQVVALDNFPAHKYPKIAAAIQGAGCKLLFLPRYSSEFNPDRALLEQAEKRTAQPGGANGGEATIRHE